MKKLLLWLYVAASLMFGGFAGIAASAGICYAIWGPRILAAGPPDKSSASFWLGLLLLVPSLLFGLVSAFLVLILPVGFRFPEILEALRVEDVRVARALVWYAEKLLAYARQQVKVDGKP
jgi:nitrate reductase gamma subunit